MLVVKLELVVAEVVNGISTLFKTKPRVEAMLSRLLLP